MKKLRGCLKGCLTVIVAVLVVVLAWWNWPVFITIPEGGPIADTWLDYGNDRGGTRHSPSEQINPENVKGLEIAWEYHTGDVSDGRGEIPSTSAFEATPILVDGLLYVVTPFNRVIALDPESGEEQWVYDPKVNLQGHYANQLTCRGVSFWAGGEGDGQRRVFVATNDARLIAVDAKTGAPCTDFGEKGTVDLNKGAGEQRWLGEYQVTSPPAIVGDIVVVGSAVSDNGRVNPPSGVVRAFDARSGVQRWAWDLRPPGAEPPPEMLSDEGFMLGTPNVWAPMSVDEARGLVFVPTGNPAPDYYGGLRNNADYYGSSVVALKGVTGEIVWHFQTVHHDLWDYDVPCQPTLVDIERDGEKIPAVLQATKMGMIFTLHRETGVPLFEVEERPVPQSTVPGEQTSPTQPFPVKPPPLVPHDMDPEAAWGIFGDDTSACRDLLRDVHFEGIYTPPQLERVTLMYPGNGGGSNWGGVAVDPARQIVVANTFDLPFTVTLVPGEDVDRHRKEQPEKEIGRQAGTPYGMIRHRVLSPLELPCNPPPWGTLAGVNLRTGEIAWQVPLGTVRDLAPVPIPLKLGVPNLGGPMTTASGLVFIGAAMDNYLRAFDIETGEELWKGRLPAGGQATPMTYRLRPDSKQFVVIAAGGHGRAGTTLGDSVVAFTLRGER
jgi:quinoprotein glucose dehydrogenase